MPSNNELIKDAHALADELGIKVDTKELDNAQLANLVKDLRAKVKDKETISQADGGDGGDKVTQAAQAKKAARKSGKTPKPERPPYYMAPGCSITSKRGILSGDTADEVKARDLSGGQEALDAFVDSGHVLRGA